MSASGSARVVLENVARMLADKFKISVVFRGNECHTDGKTITLPVLTDHVPEALIEKLRGYLDHEVGHIIFTDMDAFRTAPLYGLERFALNVVEDVRIEREMEKVWSGCRLNLERTQDYCLRDLAESFKKGSIDPVQAIFFLFIVAARRGVDHPFVAEHGTGYMPVLENLADEMEATNTLSSTQEALVLARKILEKIEHFIEDEKKKAAKTEGLAGGDGDDTTTLKDGDKVTIKKVPGKKGKKTKLEVEEGAKIEVKIEEPETAEEPEPAEETRGDGLMAPAADEDAGDEDCKEGGFPSDTPGSEEGAPGGDDSLLKALEASFKDKTERKDLMKVSKESGIVDDAMDLSKGSGWRVYSKEYDSFKPYPSRGCDVSVYQAVKANLNDTVSVMKNQLMRLLLSKKRSRWEGGKRKGFLNPAALHHVANKTSDQVYRTRKEGTKINTAVSILVDLSGSMGRAGKIAKARETTVLLAETLHMLNVPFEILGFTGDTDACTDPAARSFSRWGSLDIFYFKLFEEGLTAQAKARIGEMDAHRENYDGESVRLAADRLLQRKEKKKILFVLSDGIPSAHRCRYEQLGGHLRKVCKELEKIPDFYLCAFGINTDAPSHFYRNNVTVNDLKDLPKTLMTKLYKALVLE